MWCGRWVCEVLVETAPDFRLEEARIQTTRVSHIKIFKILKKNALCAFAGTVISSG
jgi:hypothetical protein